MKRYAPPATASYAPEPILVASPASYAETDAAPQASTGAAPRSRSKYRGEAMLTGPLASAPAARRMASSGDALVAQGFKSEAAPPGAPAAIQVAPASAARAAEQLDIEAKLQIDVLDIERGREKVRQLAEHFGGQLLNETVEDDRSSRGASLSLKIPAANVRTFLDELREVGKVRSSSLETRDVSRMLNDAEVVKRNLEHAMARYEELFAKAANVSEATALEEALTRVRTELDRVKSDLQWSRDRVARATVYVTLALAPDSDEVVPVARFYPGLRAALLVDVPPRAFSHRANAYVGAGFSLQWTRDIDVDADFFKDLSGAHGGAVNFYMVTLGAATYSDFLGGGKRRFLNPFLGFRLGYAHAPSRSLFPVGGTLGVDIYKSERVLFGFDTRLYGMFGRKEGPDFAIEPALGLNVAY